jgi:hypothetical protein
MCVYVCVNMELHTNKLALICAERRERKKNFGGRKCFYFLWQILEMECEWLDRGWNEHKKSINLLCTHRNKQTAA